MKRSKVTFYSSPHFFSVEHGTRKATWGELWRMLFGAELMVDWKPIPGNRIVMLAPNIYFGHPETVERVKADIERALALGAVRRPHA